MKLPFFANNLSQLELQIESSSHLGLRECQIGAYWSVLAHFTMSPGPAMVSLPTGAGKTALMQILAFGLAATRVLVIEPSTILRDQVASSFETLQTLKEIGVIPAHVK